MSNVQGWQQSFIRNLSYNKSSQSIQLQSPWGMNIGSGATIPTV